MNKIKKTPYYSYCIGNLPKGCQLCVKGEKTVLFITGLCSRKPLCYFCPISDTKSGKDVVYVNEWPTRSLKDLETEIKLCSSKGIGITGGDPLMRVDRCVKYIRFLKKKFGKNFHIHLYTPLNLVNEKNLKRLYDAGLDEVRFHLDLDDDKFWPRIKLANKIGWDIGVEIPVIPNKKKQTIKLIGFVKDKINFLNLNELEVADNKVSKLTEIGYRTKDYLSYGVKGSENFAKELLKYCSRNTNIKVHYCSSRLKDRVQLANRIRKRAENVKKSFDNVTEEGMLVRGAIYLKELAPSFGYREKLGRANTKTVVNKLKKIKNELGKGKKGKLMEIDKDKPRILTSVETLKELKPVLKQKGLIGAVVEEYPTHDMTEIEISFLDS